MKSSTQYCLSQFNSASNSTSTPLYKDTSMFPPTSPLTHPHHQLDTGIVKRENHGYQTSLIQHNNVVGNRSETDYLILNDGLQIRVQGIPSTGAKSRVETQIKLCIQLTSKDGVKAPYWSYLRIHESMLARSKLGKSQQQKLLDGSAAAMVSDESKVLDLEARVICESDENKKIRMCRGCVRRERKRAERKKDSKPSIYEMNSGVVDEAFERDRQRILLFNCEPLVNFSTGDAILPTRITCYCRHHNERIGFRVRFIMKNDKGMVVASGESPPVMITDDHKSSKHRVPSTTTHSRKRCRAVSLESEDEADALATPVSSRRNSVSESEAEGDATPLSTDTTSLVPSYFSSASSTSAPSVLRHFSTSPHPTPGEEDSILNDSSNEITSPRTPTTNGLWQNMMSNNSCSHFQLPVAEMSNLHHRRTTNPPILSQPIMLQDNEFDEHTALPPTRRRRRLNDLMMPDTCSPSLLTVNFMQQNHQDIMYHQPYTPTANTTPTTLSPSLISPTMNELNLHQLHPLIPILDTITPSQGPTHGGVDVTIVGEGFHRGLTLMFGNRAATTVCWSPTSMICILPPAERNGPVVVSFKKHPLMRTSDVPPLFNYYEQGNQGILDLSLQVVGINNSNSQQQQHQHNNISSTANNSNDTTYYNAYGDQQQQQQQQQQDTEFEVINIISQHCCNNSVLNQTNMGGQNLLHLAGYLNYANLVNFLILRNPSLVHSQDRNDLSPLHFSCQAKSTNAIRALLKAGANVAHMSSIGTPMELVATLLNPIEFQEMEREIHQANMLNTEVESNAVSWLPSLFVYAATQYYHRNNITISPCIDFYLQNSTTVVQQEGDSLFYHM